MAILSTDDNFKCKKCSCEIFEKKDFLMFKSNNISEPYHSITLLECMNCKELHGNEIDIKKISLEKGKK